ncbi:MAG: DUF1460 domain-containing protein [Paucibacter sp.]|nr:DUF1460 domain-containing protein [Roseateles sp.]
MVSRRQFIRGAAALSITANAGLRAEPAAPTSFAGQAVFDRLMAQADAEGWRALPLGELMGRFGQALLGTPYVARTLELDDTIEYCTVNLDGLDCVTFFENTLNLARIVRAGTPTPQALLDALRVTRYRDGVQDGYVSRLHYTTDWIWDNARRGHVKDLAAELPGAAPFTQKVGFMSSHPQAYRQLHAHPEWVARIRQVEEQINARPKLFVPLAQVAAIEPLLQTGDIIGVATDAPGIDIAHTGQCFKDAQGVAHFMDASSAPSRMKVSLEGPIHQAIAWSPRNTGIVVARPL